VCFNLIENLLLNIYQVIAGSEKQAPNLRCNLCDIYHIIKTLFLSCFLLRLYEIRALFFFSPRLTWRDLQHIVVLTSRQANLEADDWVLNGVGRPGNKPISRQMTGY